MIHTNADFASLRKQLLTFHKQGLVRLFTEDKKRGHTLRFHCGDLHIDCSRNHIDQNILKQLSVLAERECRLQEHIARLFSGGIVNPSEQRPALHWLARAATPPQGLHIDWSHLQQQQQRMASLQRTLHTKMPKIRHIINIGIGGSDIGIRLLYQALSKTKKPTYTLNFLSNTDAVERLPLLTQEYLQHCLFIISSKSFTTAETLYNAAAIRSILPSSCNPKECFLAVTANKELAQDWGIPDDNIFELSPSVGGRYSIWSAIALPIILCFGIDGFSHMLAGAERIDTHFATTVLTENVPVILGLLDFCYRNVFASSSQAIVPYDSTFSLLPEYLMQLIMESNGKRIQTNGEACTAATAAVVWGGTGSNNQHSFAQFLHQSNELVPIDLLVPLNADALQFCNCISQAHVLSHGNCSSDPQQYLPGNRPSTMILYPQSTLYILGQLLALYEHRTFVQATLCNINPFDQWGVEYGKKLAAAILPSVQSTDIPDRPVDESLKENIRLYQQYRDKEQI